MDNAQGSILQELYDQGLPDRDIANRVGISKQTVRNWRLKLGLPCHPAPSGPVNVADWDRAAVLHASGRTDEQLAEELGVARKTVQAWRQKNGLECNRQPLKRRKPQRVNQGLIAMAAEARAHGMNYGVYYATYIAPQREVEAKLQGGKQ